MMLKCHTHAYGHDKKLGTPRRGYRPPRTPPEPFKTIRNEGCRGVQGKAVAPPPPPPGGAPMFSVPIWFLETWWIYGFWQARCLPPTVYVGVPNEDLTKGVSDPPQPPRSTVLVCVCVCCFKAPLLGCKEICFYIWFILYPIVWFTYLIEILARCRL